MNFKGARTIIVGNVARSGVTAGRERTGDLWMLFFNVFCNQVIGAYDGATAPLTVGALQA